MLCKYKKTAKYSLLISVIVVFVYFMSKNEHHDVYDLTETETTKLLNLAEKENAARLAHLQTICQAYKLGKFKSTPTKSLNGPKEPLPHYEVFYYDVKRKLSWCPIYKAASTSWLYHFAFLGGSTKEEIKNSKLPISKFVRNLFHPLEPAEAIKFLPSSLKFLIVRNPFERILSAYRDKIESIAIRAESGTQFYYKKYGSKIVSKYRKGGNSTDTKSLLKKEHFLWTNEKEQPVGVEPTFKEFVRYLIDTDLRQRADDHWIPFYLYCTPCAIPFDIIGKVETMFSDQLLIIYKAGVANLLKPHWLHKTNPLHMSGRDKMSDIAKIYFSQLNLTDAERLYDKYKLDFELFQYDPSEYLDYVRYVSR